MRFMLGSEMYDLQGIERLTLGEILRLENETEALGRPMKWAQIRAMAASLEGLTGDELESHDDFPWVLALVIWVSRLRKGEDVTFADAVNFPLGDLRFIEDPKDHQAPANPPQPRAASSRGAGTQRRNGAKAAKAAKKTSARRSSPA